jgi:hypothetical protein
MNQENPRYNTNPELVKMREDVANRGFNIKVKSWIITGVVGLIGAAVGAFLLPVILPEMAAAGGMAMIMGAMGGGIVGMGVGGAISEAVTTKDRKKLEIDEEMVGSYMQGKNHWGAGFREEVAEYGYAGEQAPAPRNSLPRAGQGQGQGGGRPPAGR